MAAARAREDAPAVWMHPRELRPWSDNPRDNDGEPVERVAESIKRFGFGAPIVARASTREIIAGHTRWKAAQAMKLDRVPVRLLDITEREAHLLALADNRLAELVAWKVPELRDVLAGYELDEVQLAGWTEAELDKLTEREQLEDDEVPPPPSDPITRLGDTWTLGRHRVHCGDATDARCVALASGDLVPFIMVTDPPYGVNHDPHWREEAGVSTFGPQAKGLVVNDDRSEWSDVYKLFAGRVAYVWHAGRSSHDTGLSAAGFEIRTQIIWKKPQIVFGRGAYHWQHEPCWYAVRAGAGGARWAGDRKQSTVWEIDSLHLMGGARDTDDNPITGHSTQKPVECMARPIRNHGAAGDVVYDPFCGSGTTLVAAEQLDRVCVGLELSPAYCDVIVERWQRLTGGKAQRNGG